MCQALEVANKYMCPFDIDYYVQQSWKWTKKTENSRNKQMMLIERLKINKYSRLFKILTLLSQKDWGSIVNIATRLQAGRSEIQIPIGARDFSLLFNVQTGFDAQYFSY